MNIQKLIQDEAERLYDKRELVDNSYPDWEYINKLHTQRCRRAFTSGASFALSLDRWQPIDELEKDYEDVLFLFENGDIRKGFRNYLLELMVGNQGRFCSSHDDIENPITHFQPLPSPPSQ